MGIAPPAGGNDPERGADGGPSTAGVLRFLAFAIGALALAFWLQGVLTVVMRDGVPDSMASLVSIGPLSIIFAVFTIPAIELAIKGRWPKMALAFACASALANAIWWSHFGDAFTGL